jgi:hypothetical protein
MPGIVVICALVSLVGTAGLWFAPPRPRAQEAWAFVALAPLFMLICLALLGASHG